MPGAYGSSGGGLGSILGGIGGALPGIGLIAGGLGGALGSLFGGKSAPSFQELNQMFGEQSLAKRQQNLFALLANSPSFRSALGNTNIAGQNLSQGIDANLARAGLLNTSGVGAVRSGLGDAASGFGVQQLVGGLHSTALDQASQINQLLAQLYQGQAAGGTTPFQQGSGALLGALAPLFAAHFSSRRPAGAQ